MKPVELEAGMPGVGKKKKVQATCSVMEQIEQLRSVVRNAMHFTMFFLSNPLHRRMCGLVVIFNSKVQGYQEQAQTMKTVGGLWDNCDVASCSF